MNKLKIAVIGTGLVGSFHAETFFRNPNSELIAVCDIDKEKVNKIANRFKCKAYNEFESLINTEKLDAISIATPEQIRIAPALLAIEKGLKILLEKPVIGIDEVGRGPLAGPVVSCACTYLDYSIPKDKLTFLDDSKKPIKHPLAFGSLWGVRAPERYGKKNKSLLDDIPNTYPAMLKSFKIQKKVAKEGFEYETDLQAINKVIEEAQELKKEIKRKNKNKKIKEELGDLIFASLDVVRKLK